MIMSTIPMSLSRAISPLFPRNLPTDLANIRINRVKAITAVNPNKLFRVVRVLSDFIRMQVAMADGPAIDGIAIGTKIGSSPYFSSNISSDALNIIFREIIKRMAPPAMLIEDSFRFKYLIIKYPSRRNIVRIIYAKKISLSTTLRNLL